MKNFHKIAKYMFSVTCFAVLGYMTVNQIDRYIRNEDAPMISFKKLTSDNFPTYSLCLEDNDEAGGIYRRFSMRNPKNVTVYFDGRWLRHETSFQPRSDWINKWHPNISLVDLTELMGMQESMYVPIDTEGFDNQFLFKLIVFNKTFLMPQVEYKNMLKGVILPNLKARSMSDKIGKIDLSFPHDVLDVIDFRNATINFRDLLEEYRSETTSNTTYGWIDAEYQKIQTNCFTFSWQCKIQNIMKKKFDAITKESFPLVLSYQDPDRTCYTPRTKPSASNGQDYLTLDVETILEHIGPNLEQVIHLSRGLPYLRIYIHMHGQLLRMFGRDVAHIRVEDMLTEQCSAKRGAISKASTCSGMKLSFLMSQVTLLKKRHDAIIPCDKNEKNDDFQIMTAITKEVGCVPSFWKDIFDHSGITPPCTMGTQYRKIYHYVSDVALSSNLIVQPCNEMIVVTNIVKEPGRKQEKKPFDRYTHKRVTYLDMEFVIANKILQEIIYVREFGIESCWSGIGGFVGIFVGYSILQLPDMLGSLFQRLLKV